MRPSVRQLPEADDEALQVMPVSKPQPQLSPKLECLAALCALRERGIISDQAFLAQRHILMGGDALLLPAPAGLLAAPVRPRKKRRWRTAFSITLLTLAGLGALWGGGRAWLAGASATFRHATEAAPQAGIRHDAVYPVGKAFRVGPYTYAVTGYRTAVPPESSQRGASPAESATRVVVNLTVRNDSNKTRALLTANLALEDANGTRYGASNITTAAPPVRDNDRGGIGWDIIQPGAVKVLETTFEVPARSPELPIKLVIVEEGLFGADEAAVDLRS